MSRLYAVVLFLCLIPAAALAGEVEIVHARFEQQPGGWHVSTTLRHADSGWSHYADAWRIVNEKGDILGTRTLHHPHENEQPFTRSLGGVMIPPATSVVFVEAHDKVHGWSRQHLRVDLSKPRGERFEVRRPNP